MFVSWLPTAALLLGLSAEVFGLPPTRVVHERSPVIVERQVATSTGTCSVATNQCYLTSPPQTSGLVINCWAGGGLTGQFGRGQHNCTVEGHVSSSLNGIIGERLDTNNRPCVDMLLVWLLRQRSEMRLGGDSHGPCNTGLYLARGR